MFCTECGNKIGANAKFCKTCGKQIIKEVEYKKNPWKGTKWYLDCGPIYLMKKHYCYNCNSILDKKKIKKTVNSKSPEAKDYDFSASLTTYAIGDITFITLIFKCPNCKKEYTINEQIDIESKLRKEKRKAKRKSK